MSSYIVLNTLTSKQNKHTMTLKKDVDTLEYRKLFGETIKNARKTASLTQREAAKKFGISPSYLSQIENGRLVTVSLENIYKISHITHIPFAYLLYLSKFLTVIPLQYDKRVSDILLKAENQSFKTLDDFQQVFHKELKEMSDKEQNYIFSFLEEAEFHKRETILSLYEQSEKNATFSKSIDDNTYDSMKEEVVEIQKEEIEGFNELLKKMPFELTKTFIENDLGHEVSFQVPAYKKEQINGTKITSYIPPEEALESFFDIENLLNLNSELLNFRGNKLTQKQKEQIIQFVKELLD